MALLNLVGIARAESQFDVKFEGDALTSLKAWRSGAAECVQTNRSLGDVFVRWRAGDTNWISGTNGEAGRLGVQSRFTVRDHALVWTIQLRIARK